MLQSAFTLYDASAGSGKTFTLVKEYLKILYKSNREDAYKQILAITFTNKAVAEMKNRIIAALYEFSKENPNQKFNGLLKVLVQETKLNEAQIQEKSKRIIRNIIHNYASFDISTIDKFTHRVIRAFALDLNLPMSFEVSLDTDKLLAEAVDSIISQAGENTELTKILIDFTTQKTDDDKSWDVTQDFLATSKLLVNENDRAEIAVLKDKSLTEFVELKKIIYQRILSLEKSCIELAQSSLQLIQDNGIETKSFYRSVLPNYFSKIASGTIDVDDSKLKYTQENVYPKSAHQDMKDAIDGIIRQLELNLIEILEKGKGYLFYKAFYQKLTPLSLLNTVNNELLQIQKEQNLLSISEFNTIINNELKNQPAPFIYERLGERYRHFFIDEFQDTSEMQWQNLIPLIDNALASEDHSGVRGSLMLVGDPKQSIYRWRGGKAEQFIELSKDINPFVVKEKSVKHLDTNFRSFSEVIEFNNSFFKYLSSVFDKEDYRDLYLNHSTQLTNNKKGGYINVSFIDGNLPQKERSEAYLEKTLQIINEVKNRGFVYHEMVVLVRTTVQGVMIANKLTENKIPIISSETLLLKNADEVRFIIDFMMYLDNPKNQEAKVHLLEFITRKLNLQEGKIHDFLSEGMKFANEEEFEFWLSTFGYNFSFRTVRQKSLYEAVELIVFTFIKDRDNAYLQYFLDLVLEREVKTQSSISDFLAFWDLKSDKFSIPSPEDKNAVRIMTIHKSKGLEFPVVIYPFAEDTSNNTSDHLWVELEDKDIDLPKAFITSKKEVENYSLKAQEVYSAKIQENLFDKVNVLYVALTRAEEQLYIISNNKAGKNVEESKALQAFFINYLSGLKLYNEQQTEYEFGSPIKISEPKVFNEQKYQISLVEKRLDPSKIKIAKREALMWGTKQGKSVEYGNLVHKILSTIVSKEDIEASILLALEEGLIEIEQKDSIQHAIESVVMHPELREFFDNPYKVFNERTIIRRNNSQIKPDRVVVLNQNKDAILLDYKTGNVDAKHKEQLQLYHDSLTSMGYNVKKKVLVYTGDDIQVISL